MDNNNIWVGEKDLTRDESFISLADQEFPTKETTEESNLAADSMQLEGGRRDFLKMLGFGLGAATVAAGCDIPVKRAIPYVIKPEEIVPGVATYFASTFLNAGNSEPILVKTREGRPIKIEGNALLNGGTGTSAQAQASVLSLYNTNRYKAPQIDGAKASWAEVDAKVKAALSGAKNIRIVSNTVMSPFTQSAINAMTASNSNVKVVNYDAVPCSGMLDANQQSYGARIIPKYHFDKADVIMSIDADFLGAWDGGNYSKDYVTRRTIKNTLKPNMSRHFQVESHMSLTGSNADNRILVKPSEVDAATAFLANEILGGISAPKINDRAAQALRSAAKQLKSAGSRALVVSGSNNVASQLMVNAMNNALGGSGTTFSLTGVSLRRKGDERALTTLVSELNAGYVDVVIFNQCNPLYDFNGGAALKEALAKVGTKIGMSYTPNETALACNIIAPVNHFLENWGDVEANEGTVSIIQPTISRLFDTRQVEESLMTWSGSLSANGDDAIYKAFKASMNGGFGKQSGFVSSAGFMDNALRDGGYSYGGRSYSYSPAGLGDAASGIQAPSNSELEIKFFTTNHIGNGAGSENPWLMEMPDPVARTSWGNYLAVPVGFDGVKRMKGFNNLKDGDLVSLTINGVAHKVPVIQQFGQMPGTVSLAKGYGRTNAGPVGTGVGVDVNGAAVVLKGRSLGYSADVQVSGKVGEEDSFSCVQYHHTYGVTAENKSGETINADEAALGMAYGLSGYQGALTDRSVVYRTNVKDLNTDIAKLKKKREFAQHLNEQTMYPFDEYSEKFYSQGHHWGMHIDLNACTGCGACTVACMAENNVPVVGKREVSRHHEMTWLRIDRYYYGDLENPNVVYQPMMCQHCDNAPCENVCPVNATNHSSEGLNQMTYNRCVGTRYCANNCPYKVRRFNWLDYTTADLFPANQVGLGLDTDVPFYGDNLTRMVLNPDVTVRSRGVIEKCSFCVQRLQSGKLTAKVEGRRLQDTDVTSACAAACPSGAITFGDRNNKSGDLSKKLKSPLNFIALEEINVQSSVTYTMKVNNRDEAIDA